MITSTEIMWGLPLADIAADVEFGRVVIQEGGLKTLRELFGLTRNTMANILYVDIETYTKWEIDPETQLRPWNASRVARFYRNAMTQVEWLIEEGINPREILPISEYAMMAGVPQSVIVRQYRDGEIWCLDLGILGLWMYR